MKKFLKLRYLLLLFIVGIAGLIVASNYQSIGSAPEPRPKNNRIGSSSAASSMPKTSTLNITELKVGDGRELKKGDEATFHYIGTLQDGTEFDSSVRRDKPFSVTIGAGQVIKGWDEGLPGMKVGGKRKLLIPSPAAYGATARPGIPANSDLTFEVELLAIK